MASTPTTIWTALPNGFESTAASGDLPRVSIYVALRFDDPAASKLSDYTTDNWPAQVQALVNQQKLRVQLGDSSSFTDFPVTVDVSVLDTALWDTLFPSGTLVRPFAFQDHSARAIRSYSVKAIDDYIEAIYTSVANASPSDFPDLNAAGDATNLVGAISSITMGITRLTSAAASGAQGPSYNPPMPPNLASGSAGPHPDANLEAMFEKDAKAVDPNAPGAEFYRAYRFYNRGQQEQYRSNTLPRAIADIPPPVDVPKFDMHQVIAALGDHPAILRKLGLVIDCTLVRAIPAGSTFDRVRIAVSDPAGGPPSPTDQTPWTLFEAAAFLPQPKASSDILGGYLQLGDPKRFGVIQSDVDGGALRTLDYGANMARLLNERKQQFQQRCDALGTLAAKPKQPPEPQSLPALRTTGITVYRQDRDQELFDQLMTAAANNMSPGMALLNYDDVTRGYRVDVGVNGKWYSLCSRIPSYGVGMTTIMPGQDEGYVKAASGTSTAKDPPMGPAVKDLYLHETVFGWENWSLVVPRPGRSISIDRDDKNRTQKEVVRQEPNTANPDFPITISSSVPPKTLPPLRFGKTYQLRARVVDLAGNSLPLTTRAAKLITTPALTYSRYEPVAPPALVLRNPLTAGESVEYLVMRSKVGSDSIPGEKDIFNDTCERHVSPPKTSQHQAELHGAFDALFPDAAAAYKVAIRENGTWQDPGGDVQLIDPTGKSVDPSPLDDKDTPLPDGHYTIHTSASPALPYLPDPLATGVALQIPGGFLQLDYPASTGWPDLETVSLVLQAGSGSGPSFDDKGELTISLPQGTMLTLRYSSSVADADLPILARWQALNAAARAAVMSNGGQHWMLTPYREVTFVHAVQKPLSEPVIDPLVVSRNLGDPFVTLSGTIASHSQSTGRLELRAAWTETVDRLSEKKPTMDDRGGRVFERDIAYDEEKLMLPPPCETIRHEFGDTKHRWVKYTAVATTRYREHFPTLVSMPELLSVSSRETDKINIPNAARPDSPKILYIIPTFEWTTSTDKKTSTRTGRGLRVYVDRTWYSSGDDELLGVLIPDEGQQVSDALRKYVSQWGSDPIWDLEGPNSEITPSSFVYDMSDPSSMPMMATSLQLAEASDQSVTAIGIPPQYSEDRQLYFFDIVLDPGASYFSFVRLVLARFQPYSLDGAHLSRTVRADFAQLVSDRTATIAYQDTSVEVSVSGVMPKSLLEVETREASRSAPLKLVRGGLVENRAAGKGRLVSAYVEQRKMAGLGDLGWELVGDATYLQPYTTSKEPDVVYFRGNVPLPQSFGDKSEYRMVIEEREVFETDLATTETGLPLDGPLGSYRSRLVYLDTLPLSK